MTTAFKLRNIADTLEAQCEAGHVRADFLKTLVGTVRIIADDVEAIERSPIPSFHFRRNEVGACLRQLASDFARYRNGGVVLRPDAVGAYVQLFDSLAAAAAEGLGDVEDPVRKGPGAVLYSLHRGRIVRATESCIDGATALVPCDVEPPTDGGAA